NQANQYTSRENIQINSPIMMASAIIIGLLIWIFPLLVYWFAWLAVFMLLIGGIAALVVK
ncbi:MAG TPA: hypothetical protein PKK85_02750, partial [Methanobacteriaceae archaeon]|nr:hypothetical protein [Methanobacteriaceae archaeon]